MNFNVENLSRYKDISWLLIKYGRSDIVKQAGLEEVIAEEYETAGDSEQKNDAGELAADLERLGGTFIKLGQMLSTRADLLPPVYLDALAKLQDNIDPFPFEQVQQIVSTELGVRLSRAFAEFDSQPMAAASIGQVHPAQLPSGMTVVVKVQRPGIREQVYHDFQALEEVAKLLDEHTDIGKRYEFQTIITELRKSLLGELDYRREASNLLTISKNLRDFERIIIPQPVEDYTTSRVLTMQYIKGKKVTDISPLGLMDYDRRGLAAEFFHAYLKQMLIDGFFHADPHPGNIYLTEEGRLALLDLGMVARVSSGFQDNLLNLLLSISEGRGNDTAQIAGKMGEPKGDFDEQEFSRQIADLVATHREAKLGRLDAGRIVLEITRISADCGFRLPPEFTMIAKTLLNLDRVVYTLDPDFDPNAAIRRHSSEILQERVMKSVSPGALLSTALEMKEFLEKLPNRINNILDLLGNNKLEIKVDAIDEKTLMVGFQKIANRITMGLILAALIIGASMLMRVETSFHILGYPGIPMLFFLGAAAGGVALIINILFKDRSEK
ncbi:MAG: AarF/UbiB family protein [Acidobacteriota bacterium]|nr:AarF/UbiB family protein [Acidobacteriota bacterium]